MYSHSKRPTLPLTPPLKTCEWAATSHSKAPFVFPPLDSWVMLGRLRGFPTPQRWENPHDRPHFLLQGALLFLRASAILEKKASKPRRLCTVGRSFFQAEPISYFANSMSCWEQPYGSKLGQENCRGSSGGVATHSHDTHDITSSSEY